jgi:superfamily II DNA or RNA helicase
VIATTYQSLPKIKGFFHKLTIALFDEAHHICTNRVIGLIEELDILDIRRFFFTATPKETKALSMFTEPSEDSDYDSDYD